MPFKTPEDRKKYLQEYRERNKEDYNSYMRSYMREYYKTEKQKQKIAHETAYFAGFFDGEGTVFIAKRAKRGRQKCNEYELIVGAVNTNRNIINEMQKFFGVGHVYEQDFTVKWKTSYRWSCQRMNAVDVLRKLLPYLKVKKEQAKTAIEFQENITVRGNGGMFRRVPQEELLKRESYREKIRRLNNSRREYNRKPNPYESGLTF